MRKDFFFATFSALVLGVSICAPAVAFADDAQALLAKHASFVGWKSGDAALSSWQASGTRTGRGATDALREARNGLVYRDSISAEGGSLTDDVGFTGRVVWHADLNGFTSTLLGSPAQVALDLDVVRAEGAGALRGTSVVGSAAVRGVSTSILRASIAGSAPMDIYEDPSTGAFLRVVVAPAAADSHTVEILKYADIAPGKKAIAAWTVDGARYELTSIVVTPSIALSDLEPPAAKATWTYGDDAVPLTLFRDPVSLTPQIRVNASVNGHSGIFLVGTATPAIVLYDRFAASAGVQNRGQSDFSPFIGNPNDAGYATVRSLQIGNSVLHDVIVEKIVDRSDSRIAGVLGYDFFAGAIVSVDLVKETLHVGDPNSTKVETAPGAFSFPVDLSDGTPAISMPLPEGGYARPSFDTDLAGFIILSQALRDTGKIKASDQTFDGSAQPEGQGGGSGNLGYSATRTIGYTAWDGASTSGPCVLASELHIGPYKYENPPLCFGGRNVFGQDNGLIGLDFLRHFNWTFDYPASQVVLAPNGQ
jgi:hypothetical protein